MDFITSLVTKLSFKGEIKVNEKALSLLKERGFPKMKDDRWRYTKALSILSEERERSKVVLNSNCEVKMLDDYDLDRLDDSFAYLALSLVDRIDYIESDGDVEIVREAKGACFNVLVIRVAKNSSVNISDKIVGEETLFSPVTILELEEGSRVNYTKISDMASSKVVDNTYIFLDRDSHIDAFNFSLDSTIFRNNLKVIQKKGSYANLNGLYLSDRGHIDNYLRIEHIEDSCSSQHYRGVVKGRATFAGSIHIPKGSSSKAKQMNKTILLDGEMNAKPELEILHDDVECSHGATIGSIDESQLFYLQSRGIDRKKATNILIKAFIEDIIPKGYEYLLDRVKEMIDV